MPDLGNINTQPASVAPSTADEALQLINTLSTAAGVINPAWGAAAAVIDGLATIVEKELLPIVQSWHQKQIDVATQNLVAMKAAALRARVGAPDAAVPPVIPAPATP